MQLPHLLVVVISSIKVNIFILTGKNDSGFAVLHEEHYGKLISSVLIGMVFSTWVQLPAIFLPKTLEKGGHLHHAGPGKPGGCCPAGRACRVTAFTHRRKSFFSQEQCPHLHASQALSSKNYSSSPWLCFPPCQRLPPALLRGRKLLPPPGALDWTMSCWTVRRAFLWVHAVMFCLLPLLTWVHLSWCFSQMVTIRLQMFSLP